MGELDKETLERLKQKLPFGPMEEPEIESEYTRYSEGHGINRILAGLQKDRPRRFLRGVLTMTEPDYIKGLYKDLNQIRDAEEQHFKSLTEGMKEIKADLKDLRKDMRDGLDSTIKAAKEFVTQRFEPFEKSVDTRFDSLSGQNKLVGTGVVAILITLVIGFITLLLKH